MTAEDRITAIMTRRREPIDTQPRSAYELHTRALLDETRRDVAELQTRINALMWAIVAAVVVGVVMQIGGWR